MDEKTGGGGHQQPYDTETGRYGSTTTTNDGGENNAPPTPPDLGRELLDFLDNYENGKSDDELLAEDDELEEKLPEVETKVNNDALATVYNRSLQNRSFAEISQMKNGSDHYFFNCYLCAVSCDVQLRGFDCAPYGRISREAMDYYKKKFGDEKLSGSGVHRNFTEITIDEQGNSRITCETRAFTYGGYDIKREWSPITSSYESKVTHYPLFEVVYKNYNPDRTIVFQPKDRMSRERAKEIVEKK